MSRLLNDFTTKLSKISSKQLSRYIFYNIFTRQQQRDILSIPLGKCCLILFTQSPIFLGLSPVLCYCIYPTSTLLNLNVYLNMNLLALCRRDLLCILFATILCLRVHLTPMSSNFGFGTHLRGQLYKHCGSM